MGHPQVDLMISALIAPRLRRWTQTCCWGLLTILATCAVADRPRQAQAQQAPTATLAVVIKVRCGLLSVSAQDASWADVLHKLQHQTGVQIQVKEPLAGTLTQQFEALPLEQGLRRLFRMVNAVFFYSPGPHGEAASARLTRVWLVPRDDNVAPRPPSPPVRVAAAEPYRARDGLVETEATGLHPGQVPPTSEEEEEEEEEPMAEGR
jgi:hypothetical protein